MQQYKTAAKSLDSADAETAHSVSANWKSSRSALIQEFVAEARVEPAWSVARGTLEKYWARNLNQNGFIFWTSIFASALGFLLMLWGIANAIQVQSATSASILAAASGAVTQVIGTTFLVIYRSTAQQGLEYNRTLERINSVSMAWYILQTMSEISPRERSAKDAAKASLAAAVAFAGGNKGIAADESAKITGKAGPSTDSGDSEEDAKPT